MKIVTATELKSNLGEYFDLSLKGEEIVVFRHGRTAERYGLSLCSWYGTEFILKIKENIDLQEILWQALLLINT